MNGMNIGIINSHMLHAGFDPYERVNWQTPDFFPAEIFEDIAGTSIEEYAETHPHMIIWEA